MSHLTHITCPQCRARNLAHDTHCLSCGKVLQAVRQPAKPVDTPAAPSYHLLPNEVTVNDQFQNRFKKIRPAALVSIMIGLILMACKHLPMHLQIGAIIIAGTLLFAAGFALSWDAQRAKEDKVEKLKESVSIDRAFMLAETAKAKSGGK